MQKLLPQQFVDDYIIRLQVKHVVAGFDFTYGRLGKRNDGDAAVSCKRGVYTDCD
ncbi:hypothetical protein GCM10020331_048490 [Ectobacillus funiculus]